jgi:hypothetical protein
MAALELLDSVSLLIDGVNVDFSIDIGPSRRSHEPLTT